MTMGQLKGDCAWERKGGLKPVWWGRRSGAEREGEREREGGGN